MVGIDGGSMSETGQGREGRERGRTTRDPGPGQVGGGREGKDLSQPTATDGDVEDLNEE